MFGAYAALSNPVFAQDSDQGSSREEWQHAVTIVDGAALYEKPNFDAPVIDYLGDGKKIVVSKKAVRGSGGLGIFYRVKAGGRTIFITDTDIKMSKSAGSEPEGEVAADVSREKVTQKKGTKKKKKRRRKADEENGESLYFTTYIGGAVGTVQYSEIFQDRTLSSQMPVYGFRMTGPGTLFDGPPLDFNFLLSLSTPSYYSKFTSSRPTGYLLLSDVMMMLPLWEGRQAYVYYGLGVMGAFAAYKVQIKNSLYDSKEFRMGADFGLGGGVRVGDTALLRADLKYYYERTHYMGALISFQTEY